jgi:hypothetical protein
MKKKTGLISFSGGETSAFMLWWLLTHKSDEYNFIIIFANTGRENETTLEFVRLCAELFGCEIIWVEAIFEPGRTVRKGNKHKVVTFETATRNQDWKLRDDTPFEEMVKEYGLPNVKSKFSTRELKTRPITSYMRSLGIKNLTYDTFIGIRVDEFDRMAENYKELRFIYPLVKWIPFTKKHVNFWWSQKPFRLLLKGWEGNCLDCYKKYIEKLTQIMVDDPWKFEFPEYLEQKYAYYVPARKLASLAKKGKVPKLPVRIYRENRTVADIRELALVHKKQIIDDSVPTDFKDRLNEQDEACEVFSQCGD